MRRLNSVYRLLSIGAFTLLASCGGSNDPLPQEEINAPEAANLVFPENNTECNEGTIINDTQSRVTFRWNPSDFADSYEVVVKNLDTSTSSTTESATHSADITIERGIAYKWYVVSKSETSMETAKSEEWQFYNAGRGIVNYAPFPADVVSPEIDAEVIPNAGKISLQWSASDIDDDIKEFEVFFGTENPPAQSLGITTDVEIEVDVTSGTEYFWLVKTTDEVGNTSTSDVFRFSVN